LIHKDKTTIHIFNINLIGYCIDYGIQQISIFNYPLRSHFFFGNISRCNSNSITYRYYCVMNVSSSFRFSEINTYLLIEQFSSLNNSLEFLKELVVYGSWEYARQ